MNSEWKDKFSLLKNALEHDFYHPVKKIFFKGFVTQEELDLSEAEKRERISFKEGKVWGKSWQYAWMFSKIEIPSDLSGERIVLNLNPGGESTIFINKEPFGTKRAEWVSCAHHYIVDQTIVENCKGGECFELALEVYGGTSLPRHPVNSCATGFVFPEDEKNIYEINKPMLQNCSFGLWNEEAYQLWLDLTTLLDIDEYMDSDSMRVEWIESDLIEMAVQLDIEQPLSKRRFEYQKARQKIKHLMKAQNGSSSPCFYVIGNSHLDVCWLWPLEETRRKTARTFSQQIRLMDEYKEYRYLQSQPVLYEMCKKKYPELYRKIRQKIVEGQWIPDGAMWLEPDTNLSGGEALIRQLMYGKRFYKEEFQIDSKLCWLPDSFGYSAALPQILKGCGVEYLTTQKIFWSYNEGEVFPYHAFRWSGLDHSKIKCFLHMEYESKVNPKALHEKWRKRLYKDGSGKFLLPFGYGDGGGGPTRDDVEYLRREKNLEGVPKVKYAAPEKFFLEMRDFFNKQYQGELYFQCHRGTYTVQSKIKKGNRFCERNLRSLEMWSAFARLFAHYNYPYKEIEANWKNVMLNQFHDILPGSSIAKVNREAEKLYEKTEKKTEHLCQKAQSYFVSKDNGVTVFNSLAWKRNVVIELPESMMGMLVSEDGECVTEVSYSNKIYAKIEIPPCGFRSYRYLSKKCNENQLIHHGVKVYKQGKSTILENQLIQAVFDGNGILKEIIDINTKERHLGKGGNILHIYRDLPRKFDAWDIDSNYALCEEERIAADSIEIVLETSIRCGIKIKYHFHNSYMEQIVYLDTDSRTLSFKTEIDWHELHKLLKVEFATGVACTEAMNGIQFGYINRPNHKSRQYDADRFEVCNHYYTAMCNNGKGAALLNDCKYGVSMENDSIALSLIRGAAHPEFRTDQGKHRFTYAYYTWKGSLMDSRLIQEAYEINHPVFIQNHRANATINSFIQVTEKNIIIETIKLSEDLNDNLIIRLYECYNADTECQLIIPSGVEKAYECDMLENIKEVIEINDNHIDLVFRPFEIKTIRLQLCCQRA